MAAYRLLTTRATAATLFSHLFVPVRSVSAAPSSIRRGFNTNCQYEDLKRSIDEYESYGSRRLDNDFFSGLYARSGANPAQRLSLIRNMADDPITAASGGVESGGATTRWYATENKESLSLRFDMPGLDKDNVKLTVEQDALIIKGELSGTDEEPPRGYGGRIELPVDAYKLKEIKAEMKNGVLKVLVPKVKMEERKDVWEVEIK